MRYYVVADVHGFYTPLITALKEKGFFEDTQPHKLVVCGDLFDRGNEAAEVQEFIVDLLKKDRVILIRGNHEDLIEDLVDNIEDVSGYGIVNTHHWHNGTIDTIFQLTQTDITDFVTHPKAVSTRIKATPFFKTILPAMRDYFETEKYIFVHGWIPASAVGGRHSQYFYPIEDWRRCGISMWRDARWYNGMLAAACGVTEQGKTIVCGHWNASYGHSVLEGKGTEFDKDSDFTPYYADGIIAIDAHTAFSGFVNCIVLEDE